MLFSQLLSLLLLGPSVRIPLRAWMFFFWIFCIVLPCVCVCVCVCVCNNVWSRKPQLWVWLGPRWAVAQRGGGGYCSELTQSLHAVTCQYTISKVTWIYSLRYRNNYTDTHLFPVRHYCSVFLSVKHQQSGFYIRLFMVCFTILRTTKMLDEMITNFKACVSETIALRQIKQLLHRKQAKPLTSPSCL